MAIAPGDRTVIRDLVKRYLELCSDPVQEKRRNSWRRLHNLEKVPPPINTMQFAWFERAERKEILTSDPFWHKYEAHLRYMNTRFRLGDDAIAEPWFPSVVHYKTMDWGPETPRSYTGEPGGSFIVDHPIKELGDVAKLSAPHHEIDEEATAEEADRLRDAFGDLLPVDINRAPFFRDFHADLSNALGYLRGIEETMLDMMENEEWLHSLLQFMSDSVLVVHQEAEDAGDWCLTSHSNQAMPYASSLSDPAPNVCGVKRSELWTFVAAQEFTGVGPAMHEQFLLRYQLPIISQFALAHYGCCEDLTRKIDILRQIPNLRRIGVSAAADVGLCAEQIQRDYVFSYRPNPSDMVSYGFQPDRIRAILRHDLEACKDCLVEITLKDVETTQGDPDRVANWITIAREVVDEVFG